MVGEVTMICMDNSRRMNYPENEYWIADQGDAIETYCEVKLRDPNNLVGIISMGERDANIWLLPTRDLNKVNHTIDVVDPKCQCTNIFVGMALAGVAWLHNKDMDRRIAVFAGGPLNFSEDHLTQLVKLINKLRITVDVIDFGTPVGCEEEYKCELLKELVDGLNNYSENRVHKYYRAPINGFSLADNLINSPILLPLAEVGGSFTEKSTSTVEDSDDELKAEVGSSGTEESSSTVGDSVDEVKAEVGSSGTEESSSTVEDSVDEVKGGCV